MQPQIREVFFFVQEIIIIRELSHINSLTF